MDRLSKVPNMRKSTSKFIYIQCEKNSKLTYILLKLRKCGAKHATSTDQKIARVSPSGGGDWGDPPNYQKNWLVPPHIPLLCPKNADFVIFMQFLAILPKLSPQPVDLISEILMAANNESVLICLLL